MTKKDYELFAQEIHAWTKDQENARDLCLLIAVCKQVFKTDNYRFDANRFEKACTEGRG